MISKAGVDRICKVVLYSAMVFSGSCRKESPGLISDTFYIENAGASMHMLVEGNIASNVVILFIHGGPGEGSLIYNTNFISEHLENKYAVAYWDQRNSGSSQGNINRSRLTLNQIIDDLKKVISVLKKRYGQNTEIFLLSHSFGCMVATGFLTSDDNQKMISGYINADGSHDYGRNDTLTREMLLKTGTSEVAKNEHVKEWNKIIEFCRVHTGNFTVEESQELASYAAKAESYIEVVKKSGFFSLITGSIIKEKTPATSLLVNFWSSNQSGFAEELSKTEFSSVLFRITVPVLLLYGEYDFICPPDLGREFYSGISSASKRMVISPVSGHNFMFQDELLFSDEVIQFIEELR